MSVALLSRAAASARAPTGPIRLLCSFSSLSVVLVARTSAQTRAYLARLTARPEFLATLGKEAASLEAWDPSMFQAFL